MNQRIKWGVIGSGGIAMRRTIPEGISKASNASLVAVYDINADLNRKIASEYNSRAAESIAELLNSGIDAVYVGTPVNMHLNQVAECAKADKHVLCEKPLGMNPEEARKIVEICHKYNVILGTALMMRFHSQHQAALKLIKEGKLGKPVYGRAQLSCWYPPIKGAWRQDPATGGGGSLMDMGSHCIDLLEMFFGKITTVNCHINNNIHSYKSEDSSLVSLTFENGALGSVDTFFCIPDNSSRNMLELYGSEGSIIATGTIGQGAEGKMTAYFEQEPAGYSANQERGSGTGISIRPQPANTYLSEIEEFGNAILENREPSNNGMIGLRNQQILAACYKSAAGRKAIEV